ncbi:hypothetical protein [Candidatus Uabimicrobium amorphum]|uniref:hypothetical protein n=1 Tax=Uabimicrobium amorphum TaxID=2596890 RepID=UPI0034A1A37B
MNEASRSWSGPFAGQRVPINLNAIIIGFLAVLMLIAGVYVIELFSDEENLIARSTYFFFSCLGDNGVNTFQGIYAILPGSKLAFERVVQTPSYEAMAILFSWFLFVWAFFGGAINRIIAYHIAKQESMSISAAFKFSWKHKLSLFFTPIMLALVIAFFCSCNYIAGWLTFKFPLIGPILFVALFFLVILSSIFIVVLGIGLVFGFNLISSSICTEGCEGIEGVITSLQYIYSRPWSYMIYHGFVIVSCVFLLWIGGIFVHVTFNTSLVGNSEKISTYIFDENWKTVEVVKRKSVNNTVQEVSKAYYLSKEAYNKTYNTLATELQNQKDEEAKALLQEQLNGVQMYTASISDIWAYIQGVPTESYLWEKTSNEVEPRVRKMRLINFWHLDKFWTCIGVFLMIFYYGTQYFVYGYLVAYIFASSTLIYFLMRKEIDATDFDEVWEDDIEDIDDEVEDIDDEVEDVDEIEDEIEEDESSTGTAAMTSQKDEKKDESKPENKDSKEVAKKDEKDSANKEEKTPAKGEDKKDDKKTTLGKDSAKDESKKDVAKGDTKKDEPKPDNKTANKGESKLEKKDASKKDESKKDESKKDESKKDESKKDESKKDESKKDESKKDESKKDESKKDESKKDESKKDDSKKDDSKKDESKKDESKKDESKKDESKKDESKKDESKKDESKKDESKLEKKDTPSKDDSAKSESKKDEVKKDEKDNAKDETKKDEPKKEEKESTSRKVDRKEADSSTMAIPLIKRKPRKTSQKIDKNKFMD